MRIEPLLTEGAHWTMSIVFAQSELHKVALEINWMKQPTVYVLAHYLSRRPADKHDRQVSTNQFLLFLTLPLVILLVVYHFIRYVIYAD